MVNQAEYLEHKIWFHTFLLMVNQAEYLEHKIWFHILFDKPIIIIISVVHWRQLRRRFLTKIDRISDVFT